MKINAAGLSSIIVDNFRSKVRHLGFTQAGPMDQRSFALANTLVGNDEGQAAFEILMGRFEAVFDKTILICVSGAHCQVELDGELVSANKPFLVHSGSTLSIQLTGLGARAYLAISARILSESFLGSQTTCLSESNGGVGGDGKALASQSSLSLILDKSVKEFEHILDQYDVNSELISALLSTVATKPSKHYLLSFIDAYQANNFSHLDFARLCNQTYEVSKDSNRMGVRLLGKALDTEQLNFKLFSEGIALGAIQIMPDGLPTVMMQERQTIGGYPKIACLTPSSISMLGQCLPGNTVEFKQTDLYSARSEYLLHYRKLRTIALLLQGN